MHREYLLLIISVLSSLNVINVTSVGRPNYRGTQRRSMAGLRISTSEVKIRNAFAVLLSSFSLFFGPLCHSDANAATDAPVFNEVWNIVDENFFDDSYNGNDWKKLKEDYIAKIKIGADEHALTEKALKLLNDKYTRLLDKSTYEQLWKYDAIGLGLLFQSDPGKDLAIAAPPIDGSSGARAGLKKDDVILKLNDIDVSKMTAIGILDMMSNDERKEVKLTYFRPPNNEDVKTVILSRSTQKAVNPVTFSVEKITSDGEPVGYIKLREFNSESVPGLRIALEAMKKANVGLVLLDLRGNTGGGFQFALNIGGMFMDDRLMVTAVGKGGQTSPFKTSYPEGVVYTKPVIVVTDGLSASASEVLAAGLRDNCRAVVAGARTFGKGKIQGVFGLSDGEGLTMTVAQYVSPKGSIIQSKGIEPDIPMFTLNPYLNVLAGPLLPASDFSGFDFPGAKAKLQSCTPSESNVAANSATESNSGSKDL